MKSIISDPKSFNKLFNLIADIAFIIDDSGRFLKANNAALERLGYFEQEILEMHVPDLHPQDRYHEVLWLLEGILNGNTNSCRIPLLTKSKDIILVETTIEKLDQDSTGLTYFLCLSKVLSDIECENLRLKENESRWHFALENAGEGVWDWNIQTNEVYYSAQWKKMLGYTNEDIHNNIQEWQSRIHPDEKELFQNVLTDYLSGLTSKYENKYRIKNKFDEFIWILDRGKVVEWTSEKKPLRMVGIHSDISEIMNSESLIQISNQKLKDYLDNSPFGIFIADETGRYIDVNPKAVEMTGYSNDELINMNLIDLIADEDKADTFKKFGILKQNGTIVQEMRYVTRWNEKRYWKVTAVKLPNNTYLGYTEDITERKMQEHLFHKMQVILDKGEELTKSGSWEWDIEENTFSASKGWRKIHNLYKDKISTDEVFALYSVRDAGKILEKILLSQPNPDSFEDEAEIRIDNNSSKIIKVRGEILRNQNGVITKLIGISHDITELKRLDTLFQERNELLIKLSKRIPGMLFQLKIDKDGKMSIPYSSEVIKAELAIGETDSFKTADAFIKTIHPEDLGKYFKSISDSALKIELWQQEFRLIFPDLGIRWVHGLANPESDPDGGVSWYGYISDITDIKLKEYEMKSLLSDLEESRDLTETALFERNQLVEELEQAKLKFEILNKEKDKFFSVLSHDLKGPFLGFLGLTKMLADDIEDFSKTELQEIGVLMRNSASNLHKLIENLLEWSRFQRGVVNFIPEKIELREIFLIVKEMLQTNLLSKEIQLQIEATDDLIVEADKNMLMGILRNLISNAIKFSNKGSKIFIIASEHKKSSVSIKIQDHGIGIPKEKLPILFNLGEKFSRPGTEGEAGTGLGLIICKEFVEKHGSNLNVESEIGKGTVFSFQLKKYKLRKS